MNDSVRLFVCRHLSFNPSSLTLAILLIIFDHSSPSHLSDDITVTARQYTYFVIYMRWQNLVRQLELTAYS